MARSQGKWSKVGSFFLLRSHVTTINIFEVFLALRVHAHATWDGIALPFSNSPGYSVNPP